jgi:hypothetical protein
MLSFKTLPAENDSAGAATPSESMPDARGGWIEKKSGPALSGRRRKSLEYEHIRN